jgi:hypothetical protein
LRGANGFGFAGPMINSATRQSRGRKLCKNWIASSQGLLAMTALGEVPL